MEKLIDHKHRPITPRQFNHDIKAWPGPGPEGDAETITLVHNLNTARVVVSILDGNMDTRQPTYVSPNVNTIELAVERSWKLPVHVTIFEA